MYTFGSYYKAHQEDELTPEEKELMAQIVSEEETFEEELNSNFTGRHSRLRWIVDKKIWERAKKAVRKTYGTLKGKYGIVVQVYRKMGGRER